MSDETLEYQRELIRGAIEVLKDELLARTSGDITNYIDAIGRLEEARDMELAVDEAGKAEIMRRYQ